MKAKITLDLEVRMGGTKPVGTSFLGYLPDGTRYSELVRVFGEPQRGASPDGKVKAEWNGTINGLEFTIYDYKSLVKPKDCTDWHIGGKKKFVLALLIAYFNATANVEGE